MIKVERSFMKLLRIYADLNINFGRTQELRSQEEFKEFDDDDTCEEKMRKSVSLMESYSRDEECLERSIEVALDDIIQHLIER